MMKTEHVSLVDQLGVEMNCFYLSDLHNLNNVQRRRLAVIIRQISAETYDLREWNDALEYLTGAQKESNAEAARARLITLLSQ